MKKELILACFLGLVVLILVNLPFLYFSLVKKPGLVFLQRRVINSQDVYTYLAFIEQAKQGRVLLENLYTSEVQQPILIRPLYLLIGKTAFLFHLSSLASYHLWRVFLSVVFLLVLYRFLKYFFSTAKDRLFTFFLILTSAGFGFLLKTWLPNSVDLWLPEGFTFLALAGAPHFILAQTLMLGGFLSLLISLDKKKNLAFLIALILFLWLSFEHPFNNFVIILTIIFFGIWVRLSLAKIILLITSNSLGILWQYWQTTTNPILKIWEVQNVLLSPAPSDFFSGYGLLLVFGLLGIELILRQEKKPHKLLFSWLAATGLLLYAPVNFQRRFIEGGHIALGIASGLGLLAIYSLIKGPYKTSRRFPLAKALVLISLLVLVSTPAYTLIQDFTTITKDKEDDYYYHLSQGEFTALEWLKNKSNFQDIILSNMFYGNLIPGLTARKVFLGHKIQTISFDNKIEKINTFLSTKDEAEAFAFLKSNHLSFLFLGKNDPLLATGFQPDQKPFLLKVYDQDGILIYQVSSEPGSDTSRPARNALQRDAGGREW